MYIFNASIVSTQIWFDISLLKSIVQQSSDCLMGDAVCFSTRSMQIGKVSRLTKRLGHRCVASHFTVHAYSWGEKETCKLVYMGWMPGDISRFNKNHPTFRLWVWQLVQACWKTSSRTAYNKRAQPMAERADWNVLPEGHPPVRTQ